MGQGKLLSVCKNDTEGDLDRDRVDPCTSPSSLIPLFLFKIPCAQTRIYIPLRPFEGGENLYLFAELLSNACVGD